MDSPSWFAMRPGGATKDPTFQHILTAARDLLAIINRNCGPEPTLHRRKTRSNPRRRRVPTFSMSETTGKLYAGRSESWSFGPGSSCCTRVAAKSASAGADSSAQAIFFDLNLPDIHGSEVLRRLQDNAGHCPRCPWWC